MATKSYFKYSLTFTTTKILSFLILFAGVWLSLKLKDSNIILTAFMYATITQGIKNVPEIVSKLKNKENV